jgi:hypothetical protein
LWPGGFGCLSDGRPTAWGQVVSDEETAAARRENPLDELSPWTRLRDETSLQAEARRKTVERLRTPGDGTEWRLGSLRDWLTRFGDVAMRDRNPGSGSAP